MHGGLQSNMTDKIQVAKIIIQNSEGLFLAVKERESRQWELPGGKIKECENRFQASKREAEEEVNLEIDDLNDVVRVEVESEASKAVNCWITFSDSFEGEIKLDESELESYRWVSAEEYLSMDWHADAGYAAPALRFLENYIDD